MWLWVLATEPGQRHQFEILTGRIETTNRSGGEAFAVERDLDRAKQKVQADLRRSGRDEQNTELTILIGRRRWFARGSGLLSTVGQQEKIRWTLLTLSCQAKARRFKKPSSESEGLMSKLQQPIRDWAISRVETAKANLTFRSYSGGHAGMPSPIELINMCQPKQ